MASIEPYTSSRIDYLAKYLQSQLPGLDYTVAKTWITSEKGVSGNVLGLTYTSGGKQQLYKYPSQEAGLEAAANWVKNRSIYAGINTSLSGTAQQQATAIASSPWNRAYYKGVFASLTGGNLPTPSGGASTPLTPSNSLPDTGDFDTGASGSKGSGGGLDLMTPVIFLGVILVGITLIATGGLISLKGKS